MNETTIGDAAGSVWKYLAEQGPASFKELAKGLDEDRDLVAMAIGWLGRENKIRFELEGREVVLSLIGHDSSRSHSKAPVSKTR